MADQFNYADRVVAERGSEAWNAAWAGLGVALSRDRLGDGKDLAQVNAKSGSFEDWQYMGSAITPAGMQHEFRHRDHPVTNRREYREVATERLNEMAPREVEVQRPRRGMRW